MAQFNINTFRSDSWTCTLSNLPSISAVPDLSVFDLYVKSVIIPDVNLEQMESQFQETMIRHPVGPKINYNLSQIQIEWKLNADAMNYLLMYEYMRELKYADLNQQAMSDGMYRKYLIKAIMLNLKDNQKRNIATIKFTDALLLSLSSLGLTTGTADEITFTCNFSYFELVYERNSIYLKTS